MTSTPHPAANLAAAEAFFRDLIRLKLWFVWHWLRTHPGETPQQALRERVDLFRKTANYLQGPPGAPMGFDTADWLAVESAVAAAHQAYATADATGTAFEAATFDAIWPIYQRAVPVWAARDAGGIYLRGFQCGSLMYDDPPSQEHRAAGVANFHIANAVRPKSIFDDRQYLPDCLEQLMRETEQKFGATRLRTGTWLNSHPRWLELFPAEWQASLTPPQGDRDVRWHLGFWGQFLNAGGGFNAKMGQKLRASGEMPFAPRSAQCSFAALRDHLERYSRNPGE